METRALTAFEKILLALVLILANLRALMFVFLFPDTSVLWGPAWIEIILWLAACLGLTAILIQNHELQSYLVDWRRSWILLLFLSLALLSMFWSVAPLATLFRGLELLFATLAAAYFGSRLRPAGMMEVLFWFGAGLLILSFALVFGAPKTGTMYWAPFNGAWRGVYWHRNHLASITALLSAVYLMRSLLAVQARNEKGILDGFFYLLSLAILYFARSATGYIVFLVLNFFVLVAWLWLKIADRLRKQHYAIVAGGVVLAGILALSNLDLIFRLFHRDTSLTGRVPLWSSLLQQAARRPWLGHGFGAVWTLDAFREQIRRLAGWTSQPLIGDNGFLDILLHLGVIGLFVFLCFLLASTIRSIRYALAQRTLPAFFPVLVMAYAFVGNITFSLFAETEVFVWFLIVAVWFMASASQAKSAQEVSTEAAEILRSAG